VLTALSIGAQKLGQPVPLSNFVFDENSGRSHPTQAKSPARPSCRRGLVNGPSVPSCRSTAYWSAVRSFYHSASVCVTCSSVAACAEPASRRPTAGIAARPPTLPFKTCRRVSMPGPSGLSVGTIVASHTDIGNLRYFVTGLMVITQIIHCASSGATARRRVSKLSGSFFHIQQSTGHAKGGPALSQMHGFKRTAWGLCSRLRNAQLSLPPIPDRIRNRHVFCWRVAAVGRCRIRRDNGQRRPKGCLRVFASAPFGRLFLFGCREGRCRQTHLR
jgi:hypothetical protein